MPSWSSSPGLDEQYVYNCIYDGVMKISMDPSANRVQEFCEIMQARTAILPPIPSTT